MPATTSDGNRWSRCSVARRPRAPVRAYSAVRCSTAVADVCRRFSMTTRADALFDEYQRDIYRRTDRLFAGLMGFQWIAGIVFALWVSPLAWSGPESSIHVHVWA